MQIALAQLPALRRFDKHFVRQDGGLKTQYILPDPANRFQEIRRGMRMCGSQLIRRHTQRVRGKLHAVELGRVLQHGLQALRAHIGANPLDDFGRRHRRAKDLKRLLPPGFAHHVASGRKSGAQLTYRRLGIRLARIDSLDGKRHKGRSAFQG
jgi:hypothetical protein